MSKMAKTAVVDFSPNDWTSPHFFEETRNKEFRFWPLFLRQLLPGKAQQTRLTLTGWFLIIVALGIGSAAYNTASNILFMTLSLVLSSLILSGVLSLMNFKKIQWSLKGPAHLRAGEVGLATLNLENKKRFLPSMSLCFLVEHSSANEKERLYLPKALAPRSSTHLECAFVPQVRGRGFVRLTGAESEFPFGFILKLMTIEESHEMIVWPASIEYVFVKQGGGQRLLSGASRRKAGLGTDLLNVRNYVPGDPPRLLHWKATARLGKPMTRQLAQEGERGYWIEMSVDAGVWTESNFEKLCSVVCALSTDLHHQGRLEGIYFPEGGLKTTRTINDLHSCFDLIALLDRSETLLAGASSAQAVNRIHFRPDGADGVVIYIDENRAGQTHS